MYMFAKWRSKWEKLVNQYSKKNKNEQSKLLEVAALSEKIKKLKQHQSVLIEESKQ